MIINPKLLEGCIYNERIKKTKNITFYHFVEFHESLLGTFLSVPKTGLRLREIELRSCLGVSFCVHWELVLHIHKFIICIMFQQYVNAEFIRFIRPHAVLWFQ